MDTQSQEPLQSQPAGSKPREKVRSRPAVVVLSVLSILALVGVGVLGLLYYGQQQRANSAEAQIERLFKENASLKSQDSQTTEGKDFIDQTAICNTAYATVEAFMSTSGMTRQGTDCDIRYLDAGFARVNVNYMTYDATNGKQKPTGKGETFYFKQVTDQPIQTKSWALIGINPLDADEMQSLKNRYGVPDEAFTADKPA